MEIYFHSCLCSYLPRVPILVEDTVNINEDFRCKKPLSPFYFQISFFFLSGSYENNILKKNKGIQ